MNFKKIFVSLLTSVAMIFSAGATVSAETYTYDLKTYENSNNSSIVYYTIEYGPTVNNNPFLIKKDSEVFIASFVNTNVTDILSVSIETEQIANAGGLYANSATQKYGYTKDSQIAASSNFYSYSPNIFYGKYVEIPFNITNGFSVGQSLNTLGYSSNCDYGFNHLKLVFTCRIAKNYINEQPSGTVEIVNIVDEKGENIRPNRATFTYSNDITREYKVYPFRTSFRTFAYLTDDGTTLYTNDVFTALRTSKSINGQYYFNPIAHINDLIAENDDISFTFVSYYNTQNVYNPFNYINMDLFSGSLVINKEFTLSLYDTESFSWNKDRLTFNWSTLTENKVTNANKFLTSMNLYTTRDWYWDSLIIETINNEEVAVEDVSAGAGFWDAYKVIK